LDFGKSNPSPPLTVIMTYLSSWNVRYLYYFNGLTLLGLISGMDHTYGVAICRIFLSFTSLDISLLRTSLARQKSKGDNGSPCLTPLLQGKKPTKLPFILIENIGKWRIVLIQPTNNG